MTKGAGGAPGRPSGCLQGSGHSFQLRPLKDSDDARRPGSSSHSVRIQMGLPSSSSGFGGTPREEEEEEEEISPKWCLCSNMTMATATSLPEGLLKPACIHRAVPREGRRCKNRLGTQRCNSPSLCSLWDIRPSLSPATWPKGQS